MLVDHQELTCISCVDCGCSVMDLPREMDVGDYWGKSQGNPCSQGNLTFIYIYIYKDEGSGKYVK